MLWRSLIGQSVPGPRLISGCVDRDEEQLLQADRMNRRPDYALCICVRENLERVLEENSPCRQRYVQLSPPGLHS